MMLNCIHYTSIHADLYREYADTSWMGKTQGVKDVRSSCVRYESVWTIFDDVQRVEDASNFTKTNPNEESPRRILDISLKAQVALTGEIPASEALVTQAATSNFEPTIWKVSENALIRYETFGKGDAKICVLMMVILLAICLYTMDGETTESEAVLWHVY